MLAKRASDRNAGQTQVASTHRCLVTAKGREVIAAVLAINQASISKLKQCAWEELERP